MTQTKQKQIILPKNFLLGAATSSHQIEGNNSKNDWWYWEQQGRVPKSGQACDSYNRYKEDFKITKEIGLNTFRLSIEWSRVEPEPGKFSVAEIKHYREVLQELKSQQLTSVVSLHHFTLPLWAANQGGFKSNKVIQSFAQFAKMMAQELGDLVDYWNTINEPGVYVNMGYIQGFWPPFSKNVLDAGIIYYLKFVKVHKLAYQAIKSVDPNAQVGLAKNNLYNAPFRPSSFLDRLIVKFSDWYGNYLFLDRIKNHLDFIGINYYFTHTLKLSLTRGVEHIKIGGLSSDMGWRTYPEGIYHVTRDLYQRYKLPILITENGIANAHDDMRQDFIWQHLLWLQKAMSEGVQIIGYLYWSLLDNYEWSDGYGPKFGLVEVNMQTFERKVRPSAQVYKKIQIKK
ncbi:MAG: glycoside hydrolase family 1 protein [Candidatus Doudnabacteria bacterium]